MWNAGLVTEFDLSDSEIAPDWEAELQEEQRTLGHTVTNTAGHEDVLYATGSLQSQLVRQRKVTHHKGSAQPAGLLRQRWGVESGPRSR